MPPCKAFLKDGRATALHCAATFSQARAITHISELGVDASAAGSIEQYALHMAAKKGCLQVVLALLDCGADANFQGTSDESPLLAAFSVPIMKLLLERGANPDGTGAPGWMPLHFAAYRANAAAVGALLLHGASASLTDSSLETPLHLCALGGGLYRETSKQRIEFASLLLNYHAGVNARDFDGDIPLSLATHNRLTGLTYTDDPLCAFLIARGGLM